MFAKIRQSALEVAFSLVTHTPYRSHQNRGRRHDARLLHDNVEVFLRAKVSGEAAFVHHIVREAQSHLLGNDAARAMRDVPERPRVNKSRRAVGGLREIRKNRFIQQRHHAAGRGQIFRANGLSAPSDADDDGLQPR